MADATCPEQATTLALVAGTLASTDVGRARAHLAACEICSALARSAGTAETMRVEPDGQTVTDHEDGGPRRPSGMRTTIGRYRVLSRLGAGGMGTVYVAEDPDLDRKVAIKVLHTTSDASSARLGREARALAKLRHPNVVTIHEVGRDSNDAFVAMEFVDGMTLREWALQPHSLDEKLEILRQAARGLVAAHAVGLVHRDFKPDNVMVGASGRVQVLDFGLAKSAASTEADDARSDDAPLHLDGLTRTGAIVGTPSYMAPEQFAGRATDARTDQFAFAVTAFELLNGFRPFAGTTYETLLEAVTSGTRDARPRPPEVPPQIQAALDRAMSVDPAQRFESIDALIAAFAPAKPSRARVALVGGALVAVGALAFAFGHGPTPPAPPADPTAALFAASQLPEPIATPLPGDPFKVTIHRLSNGLTVWISPNRKSPRIAATLIVRAGSRDVPDHRAAISHLVEHMLGKGTDKLGTTDYTAEKPHLDRIRDLYAQREHATSEAERANLLAQIDRENVEASRFAIPGELDTVTAALGVTGVSASTSFDTTTLTADVPSNRFAQWAELQGERWRDPMFRLFHTEVGLMFSEVLTSRTRDSASPMFDAIMGSLYPGHPYGAPIGGTFEDIVAEPFTAAETFLATWYVPNNAALFLAGDIDASQAIPVLERALAGWKPKPLPARDDREAPMPPAGAKAVVHANEEPYRQLAYRAPPDGSPDWLVMLVVTEFVTHVGSTRGSFAAWNMPLANGSMFAIQLRALPGHTLDEETRFVDDVIATLKAGTFSDATFAAVRTNIAAAIDYGHEDNNRRISSMVSAYASGRSWKDSLALRDRVMAMTKQDLARVTSRYLGAVRSVVDVAPGEPPAPAIKPPAISPLAPPAHATSAFATALLAEESVDIPPHFVTRGRDFDVNGSLVATRNTEDRFYMYGAHWDVTERQLPLVCAAITAVQHAGLPNGTAEARRERWYGLALTAQITCDATGVDLYFFGGDDGFDAAYQDVWTWLAGDGITDDVYRQAIADQQSMEQNQREQQLGDALAEFTAYGPRSAFLARAPRATIAAGTAQLARDTLSRLLAMPRTTSYFGPRDIASLPAPPKSTAAIHAEPPRAFGPPQTVVLDRHTPNAIATIRISLGPLVPEQRALARTLAKYYAVVLDARVRAGRGEGFYDRASLDLPDDPREPASIVITVDSAPRQLVDILGLVRSIAHAPVDPDQFARARHDVEEQFRSGWISPRELPYQVSIWRRHGETEDPRRLDFERVGALRREELAAELARIVAAPTFVSIAGPLAAIDTAKLGPVRTITVDALWAR